MIADAVMWVFWGVGMLTFASMWATAAVLLWRAFNTDWHWSDK